MDDVDEPMVVGETDVAIAKNKKRRQGSGTSKGESVSKSTSSV